MKKYFTLVCVVLIAASCKQQKSDPVEQRESLLLAHDQG